MEEIETYTCECGNQGWFITGEKIICTKCRVYHSIFKGAINSAADFNKLKRTFIVKEIETPLLEDHNGKNGC